MRKVNSHCKNVHEQEHMREEHPTACIASYPGLLTPAFIACSTNAGEGLVKLSHMV